MQAITEPNSWAKPARRGNCQYKLIKTKAFFISRFNLNVDLVRDIGKNLPRKYVMNFKVIYCPHHPTINIIKGSANAERNEKKNGIVDWKAACVLGRRRSRDHSIAFWKGYHGKAPVSFEVLIEGEGRLQSPAKLIVSCVEERKICPNSGQFCVGVGVGVGRELREPVLVK